MNEPIRPRRGSPVVVYHREGGPWSPLLRAVDATVMKVNKASIYIEGYPNLFRQYRGRSVWVAPTSSDSGEVGALSPFADEASYVSWEADLLDQGLDARLFYHQFRHSRIAREGRSLPEIAADDWQLSQEFAGFLHRQGGVE